MNCECIKRIETELLEKVREEIPNVEKCTVTQVALILPDKSKSECSKQTYSEVEVSYTKGLRQFRKVKNVLHSFCPFCGQAI